MPIDPPAATAGARSGRRPAPRPLEREEYSPAAGWGRVSRSSTWPWFVVIGLVAALWVRDHGPDGERVAELGALVCALGLLPAWLRGRARARGRRDMGPIPFMPLIGCLYAAYFGLPVLLSDAPSGIGREVSPAVLTTALELAAMGVAALLVGYHLLGPRLALGRPLRLAWDGARATRAAWILLPVGLSSALLPRLVELPASLARPVGLCSNLLPLAIGALVLLARRGHLSRGMGALAWYGLVPAYLLLEAADGYVGSAARAGLFIAMIHWGSGRRLPLGLILCGVLGVAVLRAGGHEFRARWSDVAAEMSLTQRAETVLSLSRAQLEERGPTELASVLVDRVAQIVVLGLVVERTPGPVPYWGGRTLATLPSSFVPRALWPDKPRKTVGQDFGHRYGILDPDDRVTSINLPQLVELYANFGRVGLVLGMLAIGWCYRRLEAVLNHSASSDANVLVAAALLSRLVNIESDISLVFGELIQLAVVLTVVFWSVRLGASTTPARRAPALERA